MLVMVRSVDNFRPFDGHYCLAVFIIEQHKRGALWCLMTSALLCAATVSVMEEYHKLLWSSKSPIIRMSSVELKKLPKLGRYPGGQEEDSGM